MFDAARVKARKKQKKIGRRASTVTISYLPDTRRKRRKKVDTEAQITHAHIERDDNPRARFAESRPEHVHPWDWHQLYVEDESVWPDLIVEAAAAAENGELQYYERRLHA
jgi:hypothetical protein